jgi:raffinose/stachyose/melibiose transport system permease protein
MRTSLGDRTSRVVVLVALAVFGVIPLVSLLTTALSRQGSQPAGLAWPSDPQWHNFVDAWNGANFLALLQSSCLIVLGVVPITLALATLAGYALAQFRVPGGTVIYALFLLGLTLPFESLITPLYYDIRDLGLLGTRWAIIIPEVALLLPFGVFWMRGQFSNAEPALTEAATMDGASRWQVFARIHLPLATPAWSALAILYFLATWNQYLLPLVLVDDPTRRTMAGGLGAFQGQYGDNIQLLCAGSLIIIAPSLLVFLVFQRSFVRALLAGAVK